MELDFKNLSCISFIEKLSSKEPIPGGGGAAAFVCALSTALSNMVCNLTKGKKKYEDVQEEIENISQRLDVLQERLIFFIEEDAKVFYPLSKAYSIKATTEAEIEKKEELLETLLYNAAACPLNLMETTLEVFHILERLATICSRLVLSDVGVASYFAYASIRSASLNVFINTKFMKNKENVKVMNEKAFTFINEAKTIEEKISKLMLEELVVR